MPCRAFCIVVVVVVVSSPYAAVVRYERFRSTIYTTRDVCCAFGITNWLHSSFAGAKPRPFDVVFVVVVVVVVLRRQVQIWYAQGSLFARAAAQIRGDIIYKNNGAGSSVRETYIDSAAELLV